MFTIKNNKIELTRGDSMVAEVSMLDKSGEAYVPQEGDSVRFVLKSDWMNPGKTAYVDKRPRLEKNISTSDLLLRLAPDDTKRLPFGKYRYDIEITFADGYVDTFINNELFTLLPEVD